VAPSLRSTSRSGGPLTPQTGTPDLGVFYALSQAFSRSVVPAGGCDAVEPHPPPIRPLAHDRTLPPVEALGRIGDAFREYDDGVA
jgi:hypothetical protein